LGGRWNLGSGALLVRHCARNQGDGAGVLQDVADNASKPSAGERRATSTLR